MVRITGRGTNEDVWSVWPRRFPALVLTGCARLVVVAPHPDDEVLGVGGLMCVAAAAGVDVVVVAVTDGAASHPGSPTLSARALGRLRPAESAAALHALGLDLNPIRLGMPDGAVGTHQQLLSAALVSLLSTDAANTWCLATWRGDGHPDHEATGSAAATACAQTGARLLEYPVWMWHWAVPEDAAVPWDAAHHIELSKPIQRRKTAAVQCFRTQISALSADPRDAPVLPEHVLQRLLRPRELVFVHE